MKETLEYILSLQITLFQRGVLIVYALTCILLSLSMIDGYDEEYSYWLPSLTLATLALLMAFKRNA